MSIKNNNPTEAFKVTRIYIYPQTLTDEDLLCTQMFNATTTGGTAVDTVIQKNQVRRNVFDLDVTITDAAQSATYTGGIEYHCFALNSRQTNSRNMNGTNIIGPGTSIVFGWELEDGSVPVAGQVVSFAVNIIKVDI